ncbi:MAG TPA: aspartate--tRNA ligase [Gemmatimonadales bacterium]|nr:aspartate--tRNA ligase [Gemmatimonadales bacterium]
MASLAATTMRTHWCGELRAAHAGAEVRLGGWVHRRRDLGGIVFVDLRDREGLVQVSFGPDWSPPDVLERAGSLVAEAAILVRGVVAARPSGQANADMPTGEVEVHATAVSIVGPTVTPAIPVARVRGEALAAEELRLRYRYLDLRRPELYRNLELRHRLLQRTRAELSRRGFLEVETPILTKPTPEGARDFLVPSRVWPGQFYALPQSPQIYKQLLMVSGYDRYFQLARCFRDEDQRADRQLEFTQIDLECSFVTPEDIYAVTEAVLVALWSEAGHAVGAPFPRMAYREAMERYGTDKPDLRFGLELRDLTGKIGEGSGEFLRAAVARGERLHALVAPGGAALSRRDLDQLTAEAKTMRASGLVWAKRAADGVTGPGAKALGDAALAALALADGDLVLACAGPDAVALPALGRVRLAVIERLKPAPARPHAFLWIEQFPLFERDAETGGLTFMHHPFTAPHPEDVGLLDTRPEAARSQHYDAVYNGVELGSGSIRITDPSLQSRVFERLGLTADEAEHRFGFLLEALRTGAPPHGGIALGFDRIALLLAGGDSLRDVIAFPKTAQARALFEGAPTVVRQEDLDVLRVRIAE